MHRINFIKGTSVEERIVDLYSLSILCIYPLCISNYFVGGDNIKYILFIIMTFLCTGVIMIRKICKKAETVTQRNRAELVVMLLVVVLLITGIGKSLDDFTNTTRMAAIAAYGLGCLIVMEYGKAREEQLHLFLCAAVVMCISLIPGAVMKVFKVGYFQAGGNLASYFLLVITIAMPFYLKERRSKRKNFYFIVCMLMLIFLLLSQDRGALFMLPFLLTLCVINLKIRLYTLKNILHLLLAALILFKGFALIIMYGGIEFYSKGVLHDVTTSVLVDLALVMTGILYCLFLDNTWKFSTQQMKRSYPEIRIMTMQVSEFAFFLIATGLILCSKLSVDKVPYGTGWFVRILKFMQRLVENGNAAYTQMLEAGGVIGLILMGWILLKAIDTLLNQSKLSTTERVFGILFFAMIIQNFFIPLQASTTPMFMIFIAWTLGSAGKNLTEEENGGELI